MLILKPFRALHKNQKEKKSYLEIHILSIQNFYIKGK